MRTNRLLATVSALLFIAMAIYTSPLDPGIPALQFTFTESAFRSILDKWQPTGVTRFKAHFAIDFPFLICYGALGFLIATRTTIFQNLPPFLKSLLTLSLPSAAVADVIENAMHLHFLIGTGQFSLAQYFVAGVAAALKWLLIGIFAVSVAYSLYQRRADTSISRTRNRRLRQP
jgi:hypothetical protein